MINAYAAFEPKGELKPFEYDPGELKPLEVEIDVHYCGICHSDLSVIDSEWGKSAYPVVAGHEVVGKISQVGSHVRDIKVGQIVGLGWHAGYCNQCAQCLAGETTCAPTHRPLSSAITAALRTRCAPLQTAWCPSLTVSILNRPARCSAAGVPCSIPCCNSTSNPRTK